MKIWTDNPRGPDSDIIPQSNNVNLGSVDQPFNFAYISSLVTSGEVLPNNTYLKATDVAGSGTLDLLKGDATDNTVLNAKTAKLIKFAINGTTDTSIGAGVLTFATAAQKIVPGATSLTFRNNADSADNLSIVDAGTATFRGSVVPSADNAVDSGASAAAWRNLYTNRIILNGSAPKIIPGSSLITFRNNADAADNLIITDAGEVQVRRGELVFNTANKGIADNIGTLAAAGTTQADAAAVVTTIARVTGANGTTGVKLPLLSTRTAGSMLTIINSDVTNALKVYSAAAGELIDGQAGTTAISVAAKTWLRIIKYDATNWYGEKGVIPF